MVGSEASKCYSSWAVPKVKELREKKARHQQAVQLVKYLCNQIASRLPLKEASQIFESSIMMAAECGNSEVVKIILQTFPSVINHEDPTTSMDIFLVAAAHRFGMFSISLIVSVTANICFTAP